MGKITIADFETGKEKYFYEMAAMFYETDAVANKINPKIIHNTFKNVLIKALLYEVFLSIATI
jgi:hypothetical protein